MKTKNLLIVILMALILMPMGARAASTTEYTDETTKIIYTIRIGSDNVPQAAIVIGYKASENPGQVVVPLVDLTIPETISYSSGSIAIPVIGIQSLSINGNGTGNKYLKSVTIGTNVTAISANAFKNFPNLQTVTITDLINNQAKLTTVGASAFEGCSKLTSITLPRTVTSIEAAAFSGCTKLTSVSLTTAVKTVGENAFFNCGTADGCTNYVSMTIRKGGTISTVPVSMLKNQSYVKSIMLNDGITAISKEAFSGMQHLESVTIPASVTTIGESAFQGSGLSSVTLHEGLQEIGFNAFNSCSSLQNIIIPSSVTTIGAGAFNSCTALVSADIQGQINYLAHQVFDNCENLTSVTLPSTLTEIAFSAFSYCTSLKDVYFLGATPPSVNLDGNGDLFRNASGDGIIDHHTITLHVPFGATVAYSSHDYWSTFHILSPSEINIDFADAKVKAICVGTETGWDTNGNGELSLEEAAAVTDLYSFFNHNTSITTFDELKYFVGLTTIGDAAFNGCSALTKVTIPEGVTTIGTSAFAYCSALSEVSMPSTLRTIGGYAFDNTGLADVTIPEGVTSIGNGAFEELTGHVMLPSTLVSIGNWAFENATSVTVSWATPPAESSVNSPFGWNTRNKTLYVPFGRRETYKADSYWGGFGTIKEYGNIPFADDNVKAICVANWDDDGDGELSVAEAEAVTGIDQAFEAKAITSFDELKYFTGITTIGDNSFHACSSLVSVTLPKNVTSIGMNAFGGCTALAAIVIPQGVTTISNSAFMHCTSLNSVELPWTLETIGSNAFYGTTSLERITIPSSVTSMNDAFNGSGLKYVTVYWGGEWTDPIAISVNTFTSRSTATLFVPEGTENEYRAADYWKEFQNIVSKIEFNDPKVKAICIANWDTDRDGELTKDEAAAVTTLGMAFTGNTEIEYFGELKYFTGLKWGDTPALAGGDDTHGAFHGCTNLSYIELPSNIEQIMNFSFMGCTSLNSVNIPSGVKYIYDNAFNGCTGLSSIIMPQSLVYIGANAFDGCTSLRWITFPDNFITFGDQAFNGCTNLTSITVNSSTPGYIYGNPFPTRANITLTVPAHAAATYQADDYWKWFKNLQEQEPDWTGEFTDANGDVYQYETGYYAQLKRHAESSSRTKFTVLSEITVDGTAYPVQSIGENAIKASYLTTLTIPASVTTVKRDAILCLPTPDGMTLKTIIMQSSVPPTAEGFYTWRDQLAMYNMEMQHMNPDLQFTPLSFKDVTLKVPAGSKESYEAASTWKEFTVEEIVPGNGNADGQGGIDINDALAVIDYILGKTVPTTFNRDAADVTGDGDVTIADVTAILNIILHTNP